MRSRSEALFVLLALWFLLVSPQRAKATELERGLATTQAQLVERKAALATPVGQRHRAGRAISTG